MEDHHKLEDLVIQMHDIAREMSDQKAAGKVRALADLLSEVSNEVRMRWVSTSGSAPSS